jgi:hypothetical protein
MNYSAHCSKIVILPIRQNGTGKKTRSHNATRQTYPHPLAEAEMR